MRKAYVYLIKTLLHAAKILCSTLSVLTTLAQFVSLLYSLVRDQES